MILTIFFFLIIAPASPLSFNFTTFDPNNHDIKYEGNASPLNNAIQLTENRRDITGHASYFEPLHLWDKATGNLASFITNFTYSIDAQFNASHSDGIALFIANLHYRMPDIQQGSGIGLASGNQTLNSTANPFVAVEFDTYHNAWDDEETDHVGIDVSSLRSSKSTKWFSVLDGSIMDASIVYNSSSKTLCAYFTEMPEGIIIQQNLCYEIDLRDYLPEFVSVGFSAATGMYSEFHRIHSWSFDSYFPSSFAPSSSPPADQSPPKNDEIMELIFMVLMIVGWVLFFIALLPVIYFCRRNWAPAGNDHTGTGTVPHSGRHLNAVATGNEPDRSGRIGEVENESANDLEYHIGTRTDGGSGSHQNEVGTGDASDRSRRIGPSDDHHDQDGSERKRISDQNREAGDDSASVNNGRRGDEISSASVNCNEGETQIDSSRTPISRDIHTVSSSVGSSDLC